MVGINPNGPTRDRVMRLIEEKDRIEREIRELNGTLESNNVGMTEPLVDADGFPRGDVDVYRVRHARHQIICLQNDHKNIMKRIEQGLAAVHSEMAGTARVEAPSGYVSGTSTANNGHVNGLNNLTINHVEECAFATVPFVANGSPADISGLREGDELLQFGSINHSNFSDVTQINDLVAHSVGQNIVVKVKRQHHTLSLTLCPRPWAQPGLLGCQIRRC